MITSRQLAIVKSTVPVLREHGETVTDVFYRNLFREHPELHNIFNPANQRDGGQSRSLAAAICVYAANIDSPDALAGMVGRIANKHSSLEVQPEHYPVVGRHLLGAIREVLGEAATDEILDAWGAAYGVLADVMIGAESKLYREGAEAAGGWRGFKPLVVAAKIPESDLIMSFHLRPANGTPLPGFRPGQYISIKLDDIPGETHSHIRQYSLSSVQGEPCYRISVKREPPPPDALAGTRPGVVSNYLHDAIHEGDLLNVHAPLGDFVLNEASDAPVVLFGGGVGVTPLLAMLHRLDQQAPDREVLFVHAVLGREQHAFSDEIKRAVNRHANWRYVVFYNRCAADDIPGEHYHEEGLVCLENVQRYLPESTARGAEFYCCGPTGFMSAVHNILDDLGVPAARRHQETFGPSQSFTHI